VSSAALEVEDGIFFKQLLQGAYSEFNRSIVVRVLPSPILLNDSPQLPNMAGELKGLKLRFPKIHMN